MAQRGQYVTPRLTYAYLSLPPGARGYAEQRLRWALLEYARLEGLDLRRVFVAVRDETFGFDALRGVIAGRGDVQALVLPDLDHVAHVPLAVGLDASELGWRLGVAVRIAMPP